MLTRLLLNLLTFLHRTLHMHIQFLSCCLRLTLNTRSSLRLKLQLSIALLNFLTPLCRLFRLRPQQSNLPFQRLRMRGCIIPFHTSGYFVIASGVQRGIEFVFALHSRFHIHMRIVRMFSSLQLFAKIKQCGRMRLFFSTNISYLIVNLRNTAR